MPLTGKYLKYSPEITLEIFTLIWNKLSETYKPHSNGVEIEYNYAFKKNNGFLRLINNSSKFGVYYLKESLIETTVQEILGYNPFEKDELVQTSMSQHDACNTCKFYSNCDNAPEDCTAVNGQHYPKNIIKDDFVLPEKWKVKINNSNSDIISKYLKTLPYVKLGYDIHGFLVSDPRDGSYLHYGDSLSYTEITFEQFQKYVLKTTEQPKVMEKSYNTTGKEELLDWNKASEEELLEEAKRRYPIGTVFSPAHVNSTHKCIVTNFNFVTTKRQSKTIGVAILTDDKEYYSGDSKYGDTAYDRLVYSDGKWAKIISLPETKVESKEVIPEYVECIFGYEGQFTKGKIYKLTPTKSIYQYEVENCDNGLRNAWMKQHFKPSTKEAFDTQNKSKQQLEQAVHCKTQEEWDFVSNKISYKFTTKFKLGYNDTINVNSNTCECKRFYNNSNYNLLSFQEWCDLNGYKKENEVKSNQEFKVGDWVIVIPSTNTFSNFSRAIGHIFQIRSDAHYAERFFEGMESAIDPNNRYSINYKKENIRHATPEEINNHLISIGQIPDLIKQESEKYPFKPLKPGDLEWEIQVPQIKTHGIMWCEPAPMTKDNWKSKTILSIDDEELPMISIIKTNTIKQLLNLE